MAFVQLGSKEIQLVERVVEHKPQGVSASVNRVEDGVTVICRGPGIVVLSADVDMLRGHVSIHPGKNGDSLTITTTCNFLTFAASGHECTVHGSPNALGPASPATFTFVSDLNAWVRC